MEFSKLLSDNTLIVNYRQGKNLKYKTIIDEHLKCPDCSKNTNHFYFSLPKESHLKEILADTFENIDLLDPYKCCKVMAKVHLKCISSLSKKVSTRAALHYRHFLVSRNTKTYKDLHERFYDTYLSPAVFGKVTREEFFPCGSKKDHVLQIL